MTRYHADPLIDRAIVNVAEDHPYYVTAIATRLRITADPSVATMATSALWVTHYNPEWAASITDRQRGAVLVHELEHLLRRHHDRCAERDPKRFNVAGDAEINQRIANLPPDAVYPESIGMPRGRTAEVYYGATEPKTEPKPQDGAGDGDGDGGDGGEDGSPSTAQGGHGQAQCGSAAGGPLQPHELTDATAPGSGAEDDGETARREVAQNVMAGTQHGTELREWAEVELGIDRAAWYTALATAVGKTMAPFGAPTRWQWPGRRDIRDMGGAMVPRWTGERPSCAVVIDTSSSITPFDLEMAAAAAHYIARVADTVFYACDTEAINLGATLPEHLPGGGGTDMGAGIAMAVREGAKAVVVITDCYTPWPREYPGVPVIVGANPAATPVVTGAFGRAHPTTSWGQVPPDWTIILPVVAGTEVDR